MSDPDCEGGTKIQRRPVNQIPQQNPQQQMQQQQMQQQQMQQQMQQQQQMPQQQMPRQMPQQQQRGSQSSFNIVNNSVPSAIKNGRFNLSNSTFKNAVLVAIIFILLNSRIVWRAISRIPMMGSIEPSILALVVNSILSAVVFYILSKNLNKN
jgi:hypothetical protein